MARFNRILSIAALAAALLLSLSEAASEAIGARGDAVSSAPRVEVEGGSPEQRLRLADALTRFSRAGLRLPDLYVVFSDDTSQCGGAIGYFSPASVPWTISICNRHVTSVYLHELAHAWTRVHLTDAKRAAFLELRGLKTWNDPTMPWGERGFEVAANVIQAGLEDPRPGFIEAGIEMRLRGFELLTGLAPPRSGGVVPTARGG